VPNNYNDPDEFGGEDDDYYSEPYYEDEEEINMSIKVGDLVKVIGNAGGHNYPIGTTGEVISTNVSGSCNIKRDDTGAIGNWALYADVELLNVSRQAQGARIKKKIDALEKDLKGLKKKYSRLIEYEDDEEEIAANVAKILQIAGNTEATKNAIHAALKGMGIKIVT